MNDTHTKRFMSLRRRLFTLLHQGPECGIVQVVYMGYTTYVLQSHAIREKGVLTINLPPREVVSDDLLCGVQDDPTVERRRVHQAHSREIFRPVEHIGRCKLGYNRCQYLRMSPVVNTGRFFKQETDRMRAPQRQLFHFSHRNRPA